MTASDCSGDEHCHHAITRRGHHEPIVPPIAAEHIVASITKQMIGTGAGKNPVIVAKAKDHS